MPYIIGLVLALAVSAFAMAIRLDRDRAFYPVVLIVVASYYVLFAAMGASARVIVLESLIAGGFVLAAGLGFTRNLWLVAAALAAHGLMDFVHGRVLTNPGVPVWWPAFCGAYDVAAAVFLAWLLARPAPGRVSRATT